MDSKIIDDLKQKLSETITSYTEYLKKAIDHADSILFHENLNDVCKTINEHIRMFSANQFHCELLDISTKMTETLLELKSKSLDKRRQILSLKKRSNEDLTEDEWLPLNSSVSQISPPKKGANTESDKNLRKIAAAILAEEKQEQDKASVSNDEGTKKKSAHHEMDIVTYLLSDTKAPYFSDDDLKKEDSASNGEEIEHKDLLEIKYEKIDFPSASEIHKENGESERNEEEIKHKDLLEKNFEKIDLSSSSEIHIEKGDLASNEEEIKHKDEKIDLSSGSETHNEKVGSTSNGKEIEHKDLLENKEIHKDDNEFDNVNLVEEVDNEQYEINKKLLDTMSKYVLPENKVDSISSISDESSSSTSFHIEKIDKNSNDSKLSILYAEENIEMKHPDHEHNIKESIVLISHSEKMLAEKKLLKKLSYLNADKNKEIMTWLTNIDNVANKSKKRYRKDEVTRPTKKLKLNDDELNEDESNKSSKDDNSDDDDDEVVMVDSDGRSDQDINNSLILDLCGQAIPPSSSSSTSSVMEKEKEEKQKKVYSRKKVDKKGDDDNEDTDSEGTDATYKLPLTQMPNPSVSDSEFDSDGFVSKKKTKKLLERELKGKEAKTPRKTKTKQKLDIVYSCSSSDDEEEEKKDEQKKDEQKNDDVNNSSKGRKEIKSILHDKDLVATTRQAKKLEEERSLRITNKHKMLQKYGFWSDNNNSLILDMDEQTKKPLVTVDKNLVQRLKHHQKEGVRFMWDCCFESIKRLQNGSLGTGCILAHCMGLGKTFQVITLIHTLFKHKETNTSHVLVICPLSTVLNWENEFKISQANVEDKVEVFIIGDQQKDKPQKAFVIERWYKKKGVLVMGYEAYRTLTKKVEQTKVHVNYKKLQEALVDPGPDLVICDEGHLLKNDTNCRTKAVMRIKTKRRIVLTGTPLQNNLKEYYHMVHFVKPNLLGTIKEYKNRFCNPINNGQWFNSTEYDIKLMKKRTHVLSSLLKATVQRFEVQTLKEYLPEMVDYVIFVVLSDVQADLYKQFFEKLEKDSNKDFFSNFHHVQPIWTHPHILNLKDKAKTPVVESDVIYVEPDVERLETLDPNWWKSKVPNDLDKNITYGSKLKVAFDIIKYCIYQNDKVLLFSTTLHSLDTFEHFLKLSGNWIPGKTYLRMDGTVKPGKRHELCNKFNDPANKEICLFLISTKVGGLGLNLIAANRVILLDVNWNPSYDTQSIFRAYRFGQTKKVYIYRLVAKGTMEEVVYERSVTKLAISNRVVDEKQISRHYKSDEIEKMYRCQVDKPKDWPLLKMPMDPVLKELLAIRWHIYQYVEHQSLLTNLDNEELNPEEMKLAWDEYNREQEIAEMYPNNLYPIPSTSRGLPPRPNLPLMHNFTNNDLNSRPLMQTEQIQRNLTNGAMHISRILKFIRNKRNGQLERVTLNELLDVQNSSSSRPKGADLNGDQVITINDTSLDDDDDNDVSIVIN